MQQLIQQFIHQFHDKACRVVSIQPIKGGCIHNSYTVLTKNEQYFVKLNQASAFEILKAEHDALVSLTKLQSHVRYPQPIVVGVFEQHSLLLMEYLPIQTLIPQSAIRLGESLALQHKVHDKQFGWYQDNYLGLSKQRNKPHDNWQVFFQTQRLEFQLKLIAQNNCDDELLNLGGKLMTDLDKFFVDYQPAVSLLHGDLWSGNVGGCGNEPFLFDPAVYYGDREADLAMTELFGGFPNEFYQAYNQSWPLHEGYNIRKQLYNLYHILNHFNLFGGGYHTQAKNSMQHLLAY